MNTLMKLLIRIDVMMIILFHLNYGAIKKSKLETAWSTWDRTKSTNIASRK